MSLPSVKIPSVGYVRATPKKPEVYNWKKYRWNKDNVLKGVVPNYSGVYAFFDYTGCFLYVGHSKMLRHRIQSYYQKDCFNEHPTKQQLRKLINSFSYKVMPYMKARQIEKGFKKYSKFNYL